MATSAVGRQSALLCWCKWAGRLFPETIANAADGQGTIDPAVVDLLDFDDGEELEVVELGGSDAGSPVVDFGKAHESGLDFDCGPAAVRVAVVDLSASGDPDPFVWSSESHGMVLRLGVAGEAKVGVVEISSPVGGKRVAGRGGLRDGELDRTSSASEKSAGIIGVDGVASDRWDRLEREASVERETLLDSQVARDVSDGRSQGRFVSSDISRADKPSARIELGLQGLIVTRMLFAVLGRDIVPVCMLAEVETSLQNRRVNGSSGLQGLPEDDTQGLLVVASHVVAWDLHGRVDANNLVSGMDLNHGETDGYDLKRVVLKNGLVWVGMDRWIDREGYRVDDDRRLEGQLTVVPSDK